MTKVVIVDMTKMNDDQRHTMADLALGMYTGERCKFCGHLFESIDDLKARHAVYAGDHEHGRTACKACWDSSTNADELHSHRRQSHGNKLLPSHKGV